MDFSRLDDAGRLQLGLKIQQACHKVRMTQKQLAERAGYDEKTIRNVLKGIKVRPGCLEDICDALNIRALSDMKDKSQYSEEHGGYTLANAADYIGFYVSYRRSFSRPQNLLRSVYEFKWDEQRGCLIFHELQKYTSSDPQTDVDYSQSGDVFMSASIGLVQLLSKHKGALRLVTLTRLRTDETMRGVVLTQAQGEFYFQPSASAILLQKCNPALTAENLANQVGPIQPHDTEYERLSVALTSIEQKVAIFALTPALYSAIKAAS